MRWRILSKIRGQEKKARQEEVLKLLLKNRGLKTKKQQKEFFQPENPARLTPAEAGISSVQIKKAISRIKQAVKRKEKVMVYGDYDSDGVCATAIMWEALNQLGVAVMPFVPQREEGYGMKVERLDQMAQDGVKLVVTVDQGIVHSRQVAHAKKIGLDIIITDHHVPGEKKPKASAIVHTTQLSGAGVAWFLAKEMGIKSGLDLASIGSITDIVPLLGANRSLVKFGLKKLQQTKRPGLLALYDFASLDKTRLGTYEVGFIIGPRLNAAGRMEDPMDSLRLVCTRDENRAIGLAQKLDQKNRERQSLMRQITTHARASWLKEDGQSALIFVYHRSYRPGVIGLAAQQLAREFYRPTIVLAPRKDHWVASARSIEEFNIVEAIRSFADLLGAHGGHARAAGFSVSPDKLEKLKKSLIDLAEEKLDKKKLTSQLKIDATIGLADLDMPFYQQLAKFEPFGESNPQPVFATREVRVTNARTVGKENKHLKLRVMNNKSQASFDTIGFGMGRLYDQLSSEKPVDIAYNLLLDTWNNQKKLQLRLKDIRFKKSD